MFTLSDICNIAIQIERNGEAVYRRACEETNNQDHARVLGIMADDEKKHAQWFSHLCADDKPVEKDAQIAQMGRELLQNMMAQQTFSLSSDRLAGADDAVDLFSQSIEFENDTILFYEMLQSFLEDELAIERLEQIIGEERDHIDKLKQMLDRHNTEKQPAT